MTGSIKFDRWFNPDGTENFKCRAWVNYNGTGTVAIRAAGNVDFITDAGLGDYRINFQDALEDANYVISSCSNNTGISGVSFGGTVLPVPPQFNGSARIMYQSLGGTSSYTGQVRDAEYIMVSIFR